MAKPGCGVSKVVVMVGRFCVSRLYVSLLNDQLLTTGGGILETHTVDVSDGGLDESIPGLRQVFVC